MARLAALSCSLVLLAASPSIGRASRLVKQTALPGDCIPRFAVPLPTFGPGYNAALPRVDAAAHPYLEIAMKEIEQQVLPPFTPPPGCPHVKVQPTRVWAYETRDFLTGELLGPAHWPAVTLDVARFAPTYVKYVNQLPALGAEFALDGTVLSGLVQGLVSVDQTLHWADPYQRCGPVPMEMGTSTDPACMLPYVGAPPAVAHLHGGEVPSEFDGGPEAWFTPDGRRGQAYRTLVDAGPDAAIYWYPNEQEPGTPWFHDHALGATRTNVYSGLAGFYLLRDPPSEPKDLPAGAYEIELAIQDRQFDTESQLFFPDGSGGGAGNLLTPPPNPDVHPFWIPESVGDVAVVNGVPWPYLEVEPRRYRFRIVAGANARFWRLSFGAAPVFQIGADDAYLDRPVPVEAVLLGPGERADLVVDFTRLGGETVTVTNDAPIPFPDGLVPGVDQPGMASVLQFRVTLALREADRSCDPARAGCTRPASARTQRLTDGRGHLASAATVHQRRQLVLKEVMGMDEDGEETGPLEVLVNNTKWNGKHSPSIAAEFPADGVSERPRVGSTELWEIVNLTADAHPMHTHLTQFQILDRQRFAEEDYFEEWEHAFGSGPVPLPDGCEVEEFCPGYGPPLAYGVPNADGAIGGNPAVSPFLLGPAMPPAPEESGWKDTARVGPGEVMRIVVRFAPTSAPVSRAPPGRNLYPFDPTSGPGYVWHCHIVDHEDNEMMRPYALAP